MQMLEQKTILMRGFEAIINSNLKTILIAEDNEDSRIMLRTFLDLQGYRVVEARNGEEAVENACFVQPDLIILDLKILL